MTNQTTNPNPNIDDTAHRLEAIGTWDHGVEGMDAINSEEGAHKIESLQDFIKCATKAIGCGMQKLDHKCNDILHDRELREKYRGHTEEIVAGEKMAVKPMVHDDSFDAPC